MFGLFSPARDYHFQAIDEKDASSWVELIRREARIDEEEQEIMLGSPIKRETPYHSMDLPSRSEIGQGFRDHERFGSSSPEPAELPYRPSMTRDGVRIPLAAKHTANELEYSGNDLGSYSDFSDTAPTHHHEERSSLSLSQPMMSPVLEGNAGAIVTNSTLSTRPEPARNASQLSGFHVEQDDERVIWHGHLLCLKSKGGVRQWKKLWVVLRPKNLAFYKNEDVRLLCIYIQTSLMCLVGIRRTSSHSPFQHY